MRKSGTPSTSSTFKANGYDTNSCAGAPLRNRLTAHKQLRQVVKLDSSFILSDAAEVATLPKGTHVIGSDQASDSSIEGVSLRLYDAAEVATLPKGTHVIGSDKASDSSIESVPLHLPEVAEVATHVIGSDQASDLSIEDVSLHLSDAPQVATHAIRSDKAPDSNIETVPLHLPEAAEVATHAIGSDQASDSSIEGMPLRLSAAAEVSTHTIGSDKSSDSSIKGVSLRPSTAAEVATHVIGSDKSSDSSIKAVPLSLSAAAEVSTHTIGSDESSDSSIEGMPLHLSDATEVIGSDKASDSSIEDVSLHIPNAAEVIGSNKSSDSSIAAVPLRHRRKRIAAKPAEQPWCYLYTHHMKVPAIERAVMADGRFECFVHRTTTYYYNKGDHGVKSRQQPTVCGLIFLHGDSHDVQSYLNDRFPALHLVKDCAANRAALIPARQMNQFIQATEARPGGVQFLYDTFARFAANHTLIRITTGPLAGLEGYIIRIRRDRKLIMNLGGLAVAIDGVHGEGVEEVKHL